MKNQLPTATTLLVKNNDRVKVHTLISPAHLFANATHIIELPEELVLIDGQFFAQYGREFRELADSLHKPISRFYISHDHPDHYLGMGDAFQDVDIYALPEISDSLKQSAPGQLNEKQQQMPGLIASQLALPNHTVEPGEQIIGGTTFIFERVLNTESPSALVIKLPEHGIVIAQDIVYHNTHAFITEKLDGWRNALEELRDLEGYDLFLPGHGAPAAKADLDNALAYLKIAGETFANHADPEAYKTALLRSYPAYAGSRLIDIYSPILFGQQVH